MICCVLGEIHMYMYYEKCLADPDFKVYLTVHEIREFNLNVDNKTVYFVDRVNSLQ